MKRTISKILALSLVLALVCAIGGLVCSAVTVTDGENYYTLGDANTDDYINLKDLVRMKKYVADNNTEICVVAADLNGDEAVNALDLTQMRQQLLQTDDSVITGGDYWTGTY